MNTSRYIKEYVGLWLLFVAILFITGCEDNSIPPPLYHAGEMVQTRTGGYTGQIIGRPLRFGPGFGKNKADEWSYWVRINSAESRTDTRLLGKDGPIKFSPLVELRMREYELEPYQEVAEK